jgi:hypothetical protein
MAKYYVIPVNNGTALFVVKSTDNPYAPTPPYCGGCPVVIGGTESGDCSPVSTIVSEADEESHHKIAVTGRGNDIHIVHDAVQGNHTMWFYTTRSYTYNSAATLRRDDTGAKWRETTGEVFMVDLRNAPTTDKATTGNWMLGQFLGQFPGRNISPQSRAEYLGSESVEAIRKTAIAIQNGTLP